MLWRVIFELKNLGSLTFAGPRLQRYLRGLFLRGRRGKGLYGEGGKEEQRERPMKSVKPRARKVACTPLRLLRVQRVKLEGQGLHVGLHKFNITRKRKKGRSSRFMTVLAYNLT